jgi:hypothetical protein
MYEIWRRRKMFLEYEQISKNKITSNLNARKITQKGPMLIL